MTKQEAINAMREGEKVTHQYFIPTEYIAIVDGELVDEKGYVLHEFWVLRQSEVWQTGWSIFQNTKID